MVQSALKPLSLISRWSGKNSPTKLGEGQADWSETLVSFPTGSNFKNSLPLSLSGMEKVYSCSKVFTGTTLLTPDAKILELAAPDSSLISLPDQLSEM